MYISEDQSVSLFFTPHLPPLCSDQLFIVPDVGFHSITKNGTATLADIYSLCVFLTQTIIYHLEPPFDSLVDLPKMDRHNFCAHVLIVVVDHESWCLKSPAARMFCQKLAQVYYKKHKAIVICPLCVDRWNCLIKDQQCRKLFHVSLCVIYMDISSLMVFIPC